MSHSLAINWHSSFTPSLFFVSISLDTFPFQDGNEECCYWIWTMRRIGQGKDIKARIEKNTSYVTLDHSNTITVSLSQLSFCNNILFPWFMIFLLLFRFQFLSFFAPLSLSSPFTMRIVSEVNPYVGRMGNQGFVVRIKIYKDGKVLSLSFLSNEIIKCL